MKLSLAVLQKHGACSDGVKWYQENGELKTVESTVDALLKCDNINKLSWANWLLSRMLSRKDKIRYAIFAAEQVIGIYEKKYPDDKRPRDAIKAAKEVLKKSNVKTRAAAGAAWAAAGAAGAAAGAAGAAAGAAWAAAGAAGAAAGAAWAAAGAAWAAVGAAGAAAGAAMQIKIINYGVKLI